MSREYRDHYLKKIYEETKRFFNNGGVPQLAIAFIKRRMRHYGINNKYLPKDFKQDVSQAAGESSRVETSNS